jgi:hypothetical protein
VAIRGIRFDHSNGTPVTVVGAGRVDIADNVITGPIGIPQGPDQSAASGIEISGDPTAPGGVTGTVRIHGNTISDVEAHSAIGIALIGISARAEIADNEVRGTQSYGILSSDNSGPVRIVDNVVAPGVTQYPDPDDPGNELGNGIVGRGHYGARHVISDNSVLCEDSDADGIFLFDWAPSQNSVIDHNEITMVDSDYGGISLIQAVNRAKVVHNTISGQAFTGLAIFAATPDAVAEDNVFEANDVSNLETDLADVFLDENSRHTKVVVASGATVIDHGTDNRVRTSRRAELR